MKAAISKIASDAVGYVRHHVDSIGSRDMTVRDFIGKPPHELGQKFGAAMAASDGEGEERAQPEIVAYARGIFDRRRLIMKCMAAFMVLAALFAFLGPVNFTSTSLLLVSNRGIQVSQQDIVISSLPVDAPLVQNQIELLQSDKIVLNAIDTLGISPAGQTATERALDLRKFKTRLNVGRVGTSHAVFVSVTSPDSEYSAKAVNALVNAYLVDQKNANEQAAQATSAWLKERVRGLGANARIISEAFPAPFRDAPGRITILVIGAVLGFGLGLMIALVLTYLDLSGLLQKLQSARRAFHRT